MPKYAEGDRVICPICETTTVLTEDDIAQGVFWCECCDDTVQVSEAIREDA